MADAARYVCITLNAGVCCLTWYLLRSLSHLEGRVLLSGPGFKIWVGKVKLSSPLYWINGRILKKAASLPSPVWKGRAVFVWGVPVLTLQKFCLLAGKERRKRGKSTSATYPHMLFMEIIFKMTGQLLEKPQSICLHMHLLWREYSWWCEWKAFSTALLFLLKPHSKP